MYIVLLKIYIRTTEIPEERDQRNEKLQNQKERKIAERDGASTTLTPLR